MRRNNLAAKARARVRNGFGATKTPADRDEERVTERPLRRW